MFSSKQRSFPLDGEWILVVNRYMPLVDEYGNSKRKLEAFFKSKFWTGSYNFFYMQDVMNFLINVLANLKV